MATNANHTRYFSYLCKCMSLKHHGNLTAYPPKTTPVFSEAELILLTPIDVVRYMSFCAYNTATPGPDDRPLNWRSDTAEFAKKAISYYMPNSGSWNTVGHGNPTKSREVHQFIQRLKRHQVRQQGRPSTARRDLTLAEFKLAADILGEHNNWNSNRWLQAMRMQFHMIGRGDDVHHMETKSLHVHPKFDFALETSMMWSKNVLEERDCPPQIMLGAANPVFCILLSLAIYLEERFHSFGTNSKYLYTEDLDEGARFRRVKSYSKMVREKVFFNAAFRALSSSIRGNLGMHSFRKLPATWAAMLGATQDEVDVRGRWKKGGGRVSSRYINPHQPYADARVCALLCVDGPIKYAVKNGCGVSALFIHEHVCPKMSEFFGDGEGSWVAEILGTALLWACFDPQMQARVPSFIVDRVKAEYGVIRPEAFRDDVNPVEKLRLSVFRVGESVVIDELPPVGGDDGAGGGGGGYHHDAPPGGGLQAAGQIQLGNHMSAQLHGINMRLTRVEEQVSSSAGDLKIDLQRQLSTVNKNIKRLQLMAPTTTRRGVNHGNNDDHPLLVAARRPAAQLSKRPKDLYSLWTEYTHGLGGLKAARDLTSVERGAVKQKYYRRKTFWDVIASHIDGGFTAPAAVDLVYQVYGRTLSVTMILNKMIDDKNKRYNGRPHPRLRIRVVGQPRLTGAGGGHQEAGAAAAGARTTTPTSSSSSSPPAAAAVHPRPPSTIAMAMAAGARPRLAPGPHYRNLNGRRVDHDVLDRHRREQEELLTGEVEV